MGMVQNTRMERALTPIFTSLPLPRGIDAEMLLGGYYVALSDEPIEALESVVRKLIKGIWPEEVRFCPRPPELANMVREEARRIREANAPRIASTPVHKPAAWVLMRKKYEGREVLKTGVSMADFNARDWPAGTCYVPILETVFAPEPPKEKQTRVSKAVSPLSKQAAPEPAVYHDPDYWRRISELRDAPEITEEQMAFRRNVGKAIEASPNQEDAA